MKRLVPFRLLGVTLAAAVAASASAADPKQGVLDPAEADQDFAFQGEYEGTVDRDGDRVKYGVQVIALGDGKFDAVGYPGGLPGAGWNGEDKVKGSGERDGDEVVITNPEGNAEAVIRDGEMTISIDGEEIGALKRVERKSPTLETKPPAGAVVLFGGDEADLKNFRDGARFEKGHLREGFTSKQEFGDYTLHVEFLLSYMPHARGQARSNSGAYQQGRYEVQILDSFGLEGASNECGGIYQAKAPSVNMCLPPLQWQTYDIDFTAAKYDAAGNKTAPARMTVRHNGVVIHENVEVPAGTPGGTQAEGPGPGPLHVQNHGNPLWFRNIWVVPKG
ncbi:MAG TPA: DUF1080 domain-containing protein [Planctomycetaceae bacterium]